MATRATGRQAAGEARARTILTLQEHGAGAGARAGTLQEHGAGAGAARAREQSGRRGARRGHHHAVPATEEWTTL